MKKLLYGLFFLGALTSCFAQKQTMKENKGYDIKVKVNHYQGKTALLAYHFGDKQYIMDTLTRDDKGYFVAKADTLLPGGIYLFVLPPKNNYFEFLVDPKDNLSFTLETDTADLVKNMKVSGSRQNQIFYDDVRFIGQQRAKAEALNAEYKAAGSDSVKLKSIKNKLQEVDKAVMDARKKIITEFPQYLYASILKSTLEPEVPEAPILANGRKDSLFSYNYYKGHYWDNIDFLDDRMLRTPLLQGKLFQFLDKVLVQNNDTLTKYAVGLSQKTRKNKEMFKFWVVTTLNHYANSKVMGQDAIYVAMVENFYMTGDAYAWSDSAQVKKIIERAISLSPTIVGRTAPELRIMDDQDKFISVSDIKEEYTVLFFWDYDCGHCKKTVPKLVKIADAYKDNSVKFYTVETNGTRDIFKQKIKDMDLIRPNIINTADPQRLTGFDKKYDILSTPRIFVLDKDKKILAKYLSAKQLDEILNHFISKEDKPRVILEEDENHDDKENHPEEKH